MQLLFGTSHLIETVEGSFSVVVNPFSAVSTPLIARLGAILSIFLDLPVQDLRTSAPFAPLESSYGKNLEKPTQKPRRKLKSENNENAKNQESSVR